MWYFFAFVLHYYLFYFYSFINVFCFNKILFFLFLMGFIFSTVNDLVVSLVVEFLIKIN